jgi:hypothetical protein
MQPSKPYYLIVCIHTCDALSHFIAGLHCYILYTGFLKIPLCISNAPGGLYKNIRHIWLTRLLRRLVSLLLRSPLRNETLRLVNFTIPVARDTGCVIATCHTPWARLLAQWCFENKFALIVAGGNWIKRSRRINIKGEGFKELRHIVKHLRFGGRIIIMIDIFNNLSNCPAKFFENNYNVSLLPARLARLANVPLIAAVPELRKEAVDIYAGPQFDSKILNSDPCGVMQSLLVFFEKEIQRAPYIWSHLFVDLT